MNLHFRPQGPASCLRRRRSKQHRQLHPSAEIPRNLRLRIRLRVVGSNPSRLPEIERVAVGILEVREGASLVPCDLPFKMVEKMKRSAYRESFKVGAIYKLSRRPWPHCLWQLQLWVICIIPSKLYSFFRQANRWCGSIRTGTIELPVGRYGNGQRGILAAVQVASWLWFRERAHRNILNPNWEVPTSYIYIMFFP